MFRRFFIGVALIVCASIDTFGLTYYSQGSVAPHQTNVWRTTRSGGGGSTPSNFTSGDVFVIQNGHNMTTSSTWSVSGTNSKVQIENGGTLTIGHTVTLASATTFQMDNGSNCIINVALAFGTTLFQGTEMFASNSTFDIRVMPTSVVAPTSPGWGNLTINQTSGSTHFDWSGTVTAVQGNLTVQATGASGYRHSLTSSSNITVNVGGNLIVSGGEFAFSTGAGTCTLNLTGNVSVSGGYLYLAQSTGAGTLNLTGNLVVSGGLLTANAVSNINFNGSSCEFTYTAGTINTTNIVWAVNASKSLKLNNNLSVSTSRNFNLNGTLDCGNNSVSGGGTFVAAMGSTLKIGSPDGITAAPTSSGNIRTATRTFTSTANYTYNGTTQNFGSGLPATLTGNLTIESNSSTTGSSRTINNSGTLTVNGSLDLSSSVINGTGGFTVASGATLKSGHTSGLNGNITVTGTKNFNANATYEFNGSTAQVTGSLLPASLTGTLKINNSNGVSLSQTTTVTNVDITAGILDLGANNLTLTNLTITSPSASKMIIADAGELRKVFTGNGSFTFPIGDNTGTVEYSPVAVNMTSGTYSNAYVSAKVLDDVHVANTSASTYITRHWTLNQSGITNPTYNIDMYYIDADIVGNEADLYGAKYSDNVWTLLDAASQAENRLSGTGLTSFSDFTGGEAGALPVELTSFTARVQGTSVTLNWETKTEIDNNGFEVERNTGDTWQKIGFVEGHGTTNSPRYYNFTDKNATGNKIQYRLKQIDNAGTFEYSPVVEVELNPVQFVLYQNYPNPFNPSTVIRYALPVAGIVTIDVFNALGEKVSTLLNAQVEAGYHEVSFDAAALPSGMYLYRIQAGEFTSVKKMHLMK